ncbi:carbohydrate esterase family 4 protein [Plicaturopsis crispa FD-325 SS-3]|nr:carbohydrate esterase family 4 protein [Plicaturopsis crispa FD-325 SS-3]
MRGASLSSVWALALPLLARAATLPHRDSAHDHSHTERQLGGLPDTWYQPRDHPAHALFKRDASGDGTNYPSVGSPTWYAAYPTSTPDPSKYPAQWVNALNAAVSAGKIPDIPVSTSSNGDNPVYPNNLSPTSPEVCSATYQCRNLEYDIWDAPNGTVGIGFDDGPLPTSTKLYEFLQANNQKATHFMIGSNILENSDEFTRAFSTNQDDIAVHTWTHPYMTTLTNSQLLGEFGWTIEIIHNSTGGRLPRYWRPPYGDADNRVRAVAKEVFGLETIMWNQDTEDWSLTTGGTTPAKVNSSLNTWLSGPKSPGLIILEHELSDESVQAFIDAYPVMKQHGWNTVSTAQLQGPGAWLNAAADTGAVTPAGVVSGGNGTTIALPASSTSSSSSSSSASSSGTTSSTAQSASKSATPGSGSAASTNGAAPRWGSAGVLSGALALAAAALLA